MSFIFWCKNVMWPIIPFNNKNRHPKNILHSYISFWMHFQLCSKWLDVKKCRKGFQSKRDHGIKRLVIVYCVKYLVNQFKVLLVYSLTTIILRIFFVISYCFWLWNGKSILATTKICYEVCSFKKGANFYSTIFTTYIYIYIYIIIYQFIFSLYTRS